MNDGTDWNLLAKYLFDECTEKEAAEVRAWKEGDPKRTALLRQFRQVLHTREDSASTEAWDTEALWSRIKDQTQLGKESCPPPHGHSPHSSDEKSRRTRTQRRSSRGSTTWKRSVLAGSIAVILVIAGILGMKDYPRSDSRAPSVRQAESFTTEKGERATVRLSDGTQVKLNVDSRLTVPKTFGDEKRFVELEGEAFFEVETDSTRPFLVRAGGTITRVLGTAFDVSAYPDDNGAKVVVSEGRVAFRVDNEQGGQKKEREEKEVVLTERQMAQILQTGDRMVHREPNISQYLAWMDGNILFEEASFEQVHRSLERWYAHDIVLAGRGRPPKGHLNARFSSGNQDLKEVLKVVATAFRLEYEKEGKQVVFRRLE